MTLRSVHHFAVIILLAACSERAAPGDTSQPEPPLVKLATVEVLGSGGGTRAVGTVRLRREVELGFTSPGQIARIAVNDGDRVRRGQFLAALSEDTVGADLASARAEAERTRRELARTRDLFDQGWVTRARLDDSEAAAEASRARVDAADFAVRTSRITAPSDGIVLQRLAEPGQVVSAGTPILTFGLADVGFVVRVPLTDRQAAAISIGDSATVTIDALGKAPMQARLTELSGRANAATGTFDAEFALASAPGLRSGQIGTVELPVAGVEATPRLVVPATALSNARAGEAIVWLYDPATNAVRLRTVQTEGLSEDGAEITAGLTAGERVVTTSLDELAPGMKVRVQ